jgi:ABC-type branched-subunit amino acid transport system ATPase component
VVVEEKAHQILTMADHIVFMDVGRVAWSGASQSLDPEALLSMYLGAGARG